MEAKNARQYMIEGGEEGNTNRHNQRYQYHFETTDAMFFIFV